MALLAGLLGGLGFVCLISRRTLFGVLIGANILTISSSLAFVAAGLTVTDGPGGQMAGFFLLLSGIAQVVAGIGLTIRRLYLRDTVNVDDLRTLYR